MSYTNKVKMLQSVAMILVVLLVSATALVLASPNNSFAFVMEGEDCGLVVTMAEEREKVDNLNPGDTKASYLIAENTGEGTFRYFFDIKKTGSLAGFYRGLVGSPLDEVLELTVEHEGVVLFHGLVDAFEELDMGMLQPEESQQIDITVHLDGPDVGNEYQGANVTVQFMFRTECGSDSDGNSLTVRKFHDINGNGTWDSTEPEIRGWPVTIDEKQYTTPVFLYDIASGDYLVEEENREGWEPTTDTAVTVIMPVEGSRTVLFGNRQGTPDSEKSTLTIRKFFDLNTNGEWDEGESEIVDWKVYVGDREYATPVILELDPGEYTVREETREEDGWEVTTANPVTVELSESESQTVLFGNYREEEIIIPPEEARLGDMLPQTGELPPYYFYGVGALLLLAGLLLRRKKKFFSG